MARVALMVSLESVGAKVRKSQVQQLTSPAHAPLVCLSRVASPSHIVLCARCRRRLPGFRRCRLFIHFHGTGSRPCTPTTWDQVLHHLNCGEISSAPWSCSPCLACKSTPGANHRWASSLPTDPFMVASYPHPRLCCLDARQLFSAHLAPWNTVLYPHAGRSRCRPT